MQIPNEKSPNEIWPELKWLDISDSYAGVFFRVEGGKSAQFGQVQDENVPRLDTFMMDRNDSPENNSGQPYCGQYHCDNDIPKYGNSTWIWIGKCDSGVNRWVKFHSSDGEIRPKNMAIKVWKRTG